MKNFDCPVCGKRFKDNYALNRHTKRKIPCTGVVTQLVTQIIQNPLSPIEKEDFMQHNEEIAEAIKQIDEPMPKGFAQDIRNWFSSFTGILKKKTNKKLHPLLETNKRLLDAISEALSYSTKPPIENINKLIRRNKLKIRRLYPTFTPDEVTQAAEKVSTTQLLEQIEMFNDVYKKSKNIELAEDAIARIQVKQRSATISIQDQQLGGGPNISVKQYIQIEKIKAQNKKIDNEARKDNLWTLTLSYINNTAQFIASFLAFYTGKTVYGHGSILLKLGEWFLKQGKKKELFQEGFIIFAWLGKTLSSSYNWLLWGLQKFISPCLQYVGSAGLPGAVITGLLVWISTYIVLFLLLRFLFATRATIQLPGGFGKIQLDK